MERRHVAAVIEAHCQYHRSAKYDDELEVRASGRMLSPVRLEFTYEIVRKEICVTASADGPRRARPDRETPSAPRAHPAGVRMKASDRLRPPLDVRRAGAEGDMRRHVRDTTLRRATSACGRRFRSKKD